MSGALSFDDSPNNENDYTLRPDAPTAWVTVGDVSIHIVRTPAGVRVELLRVGDEMEDPIDSAYAPFNTTAESSDAG